MAAADNILVECSLGALTRGQNFPTFAVLRRAGAQHRCCQQQPADCVTTDCVGFAGKVSLHRGSLELPLALVRAAGLVGRARWRWPWRATTKVHRRGAAGRSRWPPATPASAPPPIASPPRSSCRRATCRRPAASPPRRSTGRRSGGLQRAGHLLSLHHRCPARSARTSQVIPCASTPPTSQGPQDRQRADQLRGLIIGDCQPTAAHRRHSCHRQARGLSRSRASRRRRQRTTGTKAPPSTPVPPDLAGIRVDHPQPEERLVQDLLTRRVHADDRVSAPRRADCQGRVRSRTAQPLGAVVVIQGGGA